VFEPDIIVTDPDFLDIALVVEAKLHSRGLDGGEAQLKRYMFGMQCPVGMLITPHVLRIYRDTFSEYSESSIECVGEFDIVDLLEAEGIRPVEERTGAAAAAAGFRFESDVQTWLERLAAGSNVAALPPALRAAIEEHVLPALLQGEIRAAGPRWSRAVHAQ
jgi:hypothetical protein